MATQDITGIKRHIQVQVAILWCLMFVVSGRVFVSDSVVLDLEPIPGTKRETTMQNRTPVLHKAQYTDTHSYTPSHLQPIWSSQSSCLCVFRHDTGEPDSSSNKRPWSCAFVALSVSQFAFEIFSNHYVSHKSLTPIFEMSGMLPLAQSFNTCYSLFMCWPDFSRI